MKTVMKRSTRWVPIAALSLGLLATATVTQTAFAMDDKMPMGGMMHGKMSMGDKKMMPMMGKGMSMSEKSMMMKMMPMMSASGKKTMMNMSVAEKKVCVGMCMKMECKMSMPAKKPAGKKPMGKMPMGKKPAAQKPIPAGGMGGMGDM